MARSITVIQQEIFQSIALNPDLAGLNSISKVAIYRLFVFVVAFAIWTLELLFDKHKSEIDTALYEQKSGTPRWYRNMSLAFQYGFDLTTGNSFKLLTDDDQFDNTNATDEQIEASKIIKYCSVKESLESNRLTIKVAGESGTDLLPLNPNQITAFTKYLQEIKFAGVKLNVVNNPADQLVLFMAVYRDVLVIDELGNSIKNGGKPVETAVNNYMKSLPFDGELVLNDLIAVLRAVAGVNNVNIVNATSSYYDTVTNSFTNQAPINVKTIPIAGYFEVVNYDNVTYVV